MSERVIPFGFARDFITGWDVLAMLIVLGLLVFLAEASRGLMQPLVELQAVPLSLDPSHLPQYAARTTLRMFAAMALSLAFTLTYATWAAKSEHAGKLLIPLLDILQSVPILGFISITVVFFMSLAPGRVLGAEFAAIFAIFTSQAWNMAFSFYQSLRTVPTELREAADSFRLSPWMRFWRLEVPFAAPALVWNMMMSMSGGWFFVVASEAISVGHTSVNLPGVGSYIALAIEQRNLVAIGWAIATMLIVILLYDQLFFRPLVAWVDRFRVEQEPGTRAPQSFILTMLVRSRLIRGVMQMLRTLAQWTNRMVPRVPSTRTSLPSRTRGLADVFWLSVIVIALIVISWRGARGLLAHMSWSDVLEVLELGAITMLRVFVLIAIASLVWVPIGVWVGLRPKATQIVQPIAQFLAAFPANLLFPVVVFCIVRGNLNPDVWLSPLMILGTQWYILFNVIAGASALPGELRYAAQNFQVRGWLWWRRVGLPGVFPYYVTGAITASGGSWNASIVAELASWGDSKVRAHGLGAYIASATADGDFHRIVLGVATMSLFVVTINRLFWRPLYYYAERSFRLA
ncbi:ABC transporter permease [Steroidobacter cummioxidans]|uniref:ABC transporter permease n=1 Tax=Steroidobacter cummioxidans TaxID=1803913 RepID=UPI000E3190D4|nr:ABC transporter permease subunit [Steroidobacter cummioxidans]